MSNPDIEKYADRMNDVITNVWRVAPGSMGHVIAAFYTLFGMTDEEVEQVSNNTHVNPIAIIDRIESEFLAAGVRVLG